MVRFDENRCKACGICVHFCPKNCLEITAKINAGGRHVAGIVRPEDCVSCGICYTVCPDAAITVYKD